MQAYTPALQRALLFGLLFILLILGFEIVKYFIVPVLWAAIIAYMTWPIYLWVNRRVNGRSSLSSSIMILMIFLIIGLPLTLGVFMVQHEGRNLFLELQKQIFSGHLQVPAFIQSLPVIGSEIVRNVNEINQNPKAITQNVSAWIQNHMGYGRFVINEIGKNLFKLGLALFSLFFFYRDGQNILQQIRHALETVIGPRIDHYLETISETTRAVVYGVGLTAVAQAMLAGLSYFVAGVPNPVLLTVVTFLLALIPLGAPLMYGSVSLWLITQGQMPEAAGVFIWGVAVVSTSDNVIRPLVISGATKIPFMLIMFGVLGGLASFGLVGLFVGPVVLAILLAIWREWLHETHEQELQQAEAVAKTSVNDVLNK